MSSMHYLSKVLSNFKEFYNEINAATLTGAIDVVVVEQPDGSFTCSPFHVRFGKLGVLRSRLKVVDLELNGEPMNIHMKLGESGEAFFVEAVPEDELEASAHLATSPIPDSGFALFQEPPRPPRRNSADFSLDKYENQVSDFAHRRYTDGQGVQKIDFSAQKRDYKIMKDNYDFMPSPTSVDPEPMFVMDDIDDKADKEINQAEQPQISSGTLSGSAKMFRAEEVNDKDSHAKDVVRKISINNDFRPISMAKEEPLLVPTAEVKSAEEASSILPVEESQKLQSNGSNKKKKKTKKSGSKKKNAQRKSSSSSNSNSSQSDPIGADGTEIERSNERIAAEQMSSEDVSASAAFNVKKLIQDVDFFSDTDITRRRPEESNSGTPVQSDSELEIARGSGVKEAVSPGQSWRWGELPSPLPVQMSMLPLKQNTTAGSISSDDEQIKLETKDEAAVTSVAQGTSSSMLSGMFSFMKQSRGSAAATGAEGKYLAELAAGAVDPEIAALYFPPHNQDNVIHTSVQHNASGTLAVDIIGAMATEEDYESGNGPSLPQSPSSIEGLMCKGIDSDEDDNKILCKGYVGLSLCGPECLEKSAAALNEAFEKDAVRFEMLCSDPTLVQNPRLVVRLGDKFMPWATAAPAILSLIVYHRPLPKSVLQTLPAGIDVPRDNKHEERGQTSGSKTQQRAPGYSWWNWRRSADKQALDEANIDMSKSKMDAMDGSLMISDQDVSPTGAEDKLSNTDLVQEIIALEESAFLGTQDLDTPQDECVAVSTQTSFVGTAPGEGYSGSQSSEDSDEGCGQDKSCGGAGGMGGAAHLSSKPCRKTLRLSSDQIASLNLREGMNEMVFSVTTAYQGTSRCKCHVFRWRHDDKIVISDIDGTITKSDVLGHIFPLVGKDWAQSGVAQLFTKIKNNGYKLLYLSSRAIGQAKVTREYLRSVKQGDLSLPDGPLLLNPTSLLRAFHREVIEKKPEEFKIQCLSDIMALFPEGCKPFYAGYGNRVNDVCAYQTVGIPIVRIFTINYKGELKHELTQTFQSSYSNMSYIVDHLFPPVRGEVCEDFSQFVYWREPVAQLPDILPPLSPHALPSIPEGPTDS